MRKIFILALTAAFVFSAPSVMAQTASAKSQSGSNNPGKINSASANNPGQVGSSNNPGKVGSIHK